MHLGSVSILSSGSCGNSILVESGDRGLLIDAGISCRELEKRLSAVGFEPSRIDAVVLTHEHVDHVRGARRFCIENGLSLHGTRGTLALTPSEGVRTVAYRAGSEFTIGDFHLRPFKVRHLAAEPVGFRIATSSGSLGIATDLGSVTPTVAREISGARVLIVEANYDENMLMLGSYPQFLKNAISGDYGHLSNLSAGNLASRAMGDSTNRVVLAHLSRENNKPDLAREAVASAVRAIRSSLKVEVTEHGGSSGPFPLG
jgi:phosphoribosyl 1,2-cyclic phosphodiesterase